ncbi:hypothetical protein HKD37_02G003824 [Glycine soja]
MLQRPSPHECTENCVSGVYKLVVQVSHRQECEGKEYIMDSWGTLVDCPSEQQFPECLQKFQVESAHWALKRVLQNSLGDLCSIWDVMNNMITLQHTQIKTSFETSTHVVGHVYKKTLYKRLLGMVSRYALNEIAYEFEHVRYFRNNLSSCGCVLRTTLGLPCACELQRYDGGNIPLDAVHMYWRRLSFSDQGLCEAEVSIKEEMDRIYKRFEELDVCGKVTFKKFVYPDENCMCPPPSKVNTKGAPKKLMKRSQRLTKRDPSYWEYVDASASSSEPLKPARMILILDQFVPFIQGFIEDVVDVKTNDYIKLFGGTERFKQLRLSLHVDGLSKVSVDKWMDITEMRYVIASRYNVILVSLSRQQSFTFFPLRSQPSPDSSMHRMICVGHVFGNHFVQVYLKDRCPLPPMALLWSSNSYPQAKQWPTEYVGRMQQYLSLMTIKTTHCGVYFKSSTPVLMRVPNMCDFSTLKSRIHNILQLNDNQFVDEIHYRRPLEDTGNKIHFQCMQLKDNMDVNTMLMSNDRFSCVGPIELLCTVGRTPDEILNLLERSMTPTHDAVLYYNGRWNMPRQNNFVGYAFTGKNPQKFDISKGCTIDELKDLIKQLAPKGNPPHGIHESQLLKTDDDVLKVMVESNYWKQFVPIEILAFFSKPIMENEDEVVTSLQD